MRHSFSRWRARASGGFSCASGSCRLGRTCDEKALALAVIYGNASAMDHALMELIRESRVICAALLLMGVWLALFLRMIR